MLSLCGFVAAFLLGGAPEGALSSGDLAATREAVVCGPNSLLLFLELNGVSVRDEEIDGIDCGRFGASLLDLKERSNSLGQPAEIRLYQPSEMGEIPLPAIMHSRGSHPRNHFFVLYKITDDRVFAIDGTSGKRIETSRRRAEQFFTGYALVPIRSSLSQFASSSFGYGVGIVSIFLGYCFILSRALGVANCAR